MQHDIHRAGGLSQFELPSLGELAMPSPYPCVISKIIASVSIGMLNMLSQPCAFIRSGYAIYGTGLDDAYVLIGVMPTVDMGGW